MNYKLFGCALSIIFSAQLFAEDDINHEINYGFINFDTFDFFVGDFSEFPIFGGSYRYYFTPLSGELDSDLESHLQKKSWVQYDLNLFTGFAPNIGGQYYINDNYNIEYDITYQRNFNYHSNSSSTSFLNDISVNKQIDKNWQVGLGVTNVSTYRDIDDIDLEDDDFYSASIMVLSARYTNFDKGKGWDVKGRFLTAGNVTAMSSKIRYFNSPNVAYSGSLSYLYFSEDSEGLLQASISQQRWYTKRASFDFGIGFLRSPSAEKFVHLFEINGKYRF